MGLKNEATPPTRLLQMPKSSGGELAVLLRDVEKAVRRLGEAYRAKRRGDAEDGAAAEFSALTHLAEARKIVEGE